MKVNFDKIPEWHKAALGRSILNMLASVKSTEAGRQALAAKVEEINAKEAATA